MAGVGVILHLDETGEIAVPGNPQTVTWPTVYPGTPAERANTLADATADYAVLDAGASVVDGAYRGYRLGITANTGAGQARSVISYTAADLKAFVDSAEAREELN